MDHLRLSIQYLYFGHGNFIFQFRKHDAQKKNILLRGDKLIYQYSDDVEDKDLLKMFTDYCVKYVLVESFQSNKLPQLELIKKVLINGEFVKVKEIVLHTNIKRLKNSSLFIYEHNGSGQLTKDFICYDLGLAGLKIHYPVKRLLIAH